MKWICRVKLTPKGEVITHKVRLVDKGCLLREETNFDEDFAPVIRIETIRLVVAFSNINNWSMCQMNVKCAFSNGLLDEEMYLT